MTSNPAKHCQGDRLAGEEKHMNEPTITPEAVERLNTTIVARETSAEIERGVHGSLQFYLDAFTDGAKDPRTLMMVRAACEARDAAKTLAREADDLTALLSTLQAVRGENERLREALGKVRGWRRDCHAYDSDTGQPPRDFGEEDFLMMEGWARQALSTIQNGGGEGGDFNADLSSAKRADHDGERSAGWRDIASAPRDGTEILTAIDWLPYGKVLFWAGYAGAWRCPASEAGPEPEGWQPTHWMPIPAPPAETGLSGAQRSEQALSATDTPKTPSPEEE